MIKHSLVAAALLAGSFSSQLMAQTLAETAVNQANQVIDEVLEAYGGAETVGNLNTMTQESEFTTYAVGQSLRPEAPWDTNHSKNTVAIDFPNRIFVNKNAGSGNGFEFDNGNIINGENSYQLDFRAGTSASVAEPDFDTTSGPFIRVTPIMLVKQLQTRRQTSHWLGEEEINGRPHDVITLVMEVGPGLSLYFDKETHLLTRSERILPGFGVVEYQFLDYETVDGFPYNRNFKLFVNGDANIDIKNTSVQFNQPIDSYTQVPEGLREVPQVQPDELSLRTVSDGVYHVGGTGTHVLFVEMDDYIVSIGGTAGIPDRIAQLREVTDKPIRYGVLTHHHNDHILGVGPYMAEDATILTVKENETVVRAAGGDADGIKLQFVDGSHVFDDGQRLEIIDIGPTPHAEHFLLAYLPDLGLIFEADHFPQPQTGPLPPPNSGTTALLKALEDRGLNVTRVAGAHSPRISGQSDLDALKAQL